MRQAGRYLPEYQKIREKASFWHMVRTPELAVEATLQPIRRFGMDAAILFSDILPLLSAMGVEIHYADGGPVIQPPVRVREDLARLRPVDTEVHLDYVGEAVRRLAGHLHPDVALIGFAGAPLTLAAYLVEGKGSRDLRTIKALAYNQPELVHEILALLADAVADLLRFQMDCGVDAVQVFDTWAGLLSPEDYGELALPYAKRVVERVRDLGKPVILYVRGAAAILEEAASSGCDVLSVDTSIRLHDARARLGPEVGLQGNLDPAELFGPVERIGERVRHLIDATGGRGHILNLGQGIPPQAPVEGVSAFVRSVQEWKP
jgi:uroporphyrinogen decarboxylase